MKILAIEKESKTVDWKKESQTLIEEAKSAYKMILSGHLREIYFSDRKNAVLILECEDLNAAHKLLNELPLVKNELIYFDMMELHPYTGFSRIMNME
jgi:hypothetical protein